MFLFGYLKEWRRNPHWSFSCCLALVLPLNDLQGEIHRLAGANVLKNQLQTGQIDNPSILSTLKDSGAIDVTLEESNEGGASTVEREQEFRLHSERNMAKSHQGTQTDLGQKPMKDLHAALI